MRKKDFILLFITLIILALAGYFYLLNKNPKLTIDDKDITTCYSDADCGWYANSGGSEKTVLCGNKNVNKNKQELESSLITQENSICTCSNNKCQSATFTLPKN